MLTGQPNMIRNAFRVQNPVNHGGALLQLDLVVSQLIAHKAVRPVRAVNQMRARQITRNATPSPGQAVRQMRAVNQMTARQINRNDWEIAL
jgi:hypothetical protein